MLRCITKSSLVVVLVMIRIFVLIFLLTTSQHLRLQLVWVDRHSFGDIEGFVDANKFLCKLTHVVTKTNDKELTVPCTLLDVVSHNGHVLVVQCCINLIHTVERGGFVVMKGKDKAEGGNCLLTSRELGHLLPRLFQGPHMELDPL